MAADRRVSVTLVLDDKGVVKGFESAADGAKKLKGELGNLPGSGEAFFSGLTGKIAGFGLAVQGAHAAVAGAKATFDAFFGGVERAAAIYDLGQKIGVSAEQLSRLELAAKTGGASLESLATGFKFLSKNLTEAAGGNAQVAAAFKALGVDVQAGTKDTLGAMLQLADGFAQLPDGALKTTASLKLLGRAGLELVPFLNQGREEIQRLIDLNDKLGASLDKGTLAAADAVDDNFAIMKHAFVGVQTQIAAGMLPAIKDVTEAIVELAAGAGIGNGGIKSFGEAIGEGVRSGVKVGLVALRDFLKAVNEVGLQGAIEEEVKGAFDALVAQATVSGKEIGANLLEGIANAFRPGAGLAATGIPDFLGLFLPDFRKQAAQIRAELDAVKIGPQLPGIGQDSAQVQNYVQVLDVAIDKVGGLGKAQTSAGAAANKHGTDVKGLTGALGDAGKAAGDLAKDLTNQQTAINAEAAIYAKAAAGSISLAQAEQEAAAQQAVLSKGVQSETLVRQALAIEQAKAKIETDKSIAAAHEEADATQAKVAALQRVIDTGGDAEAAQHALAEAEIETAAAQVRTKTGSDEEAAAFQKVKEAALATAEALARKQAVENAQNDLSKLQLELSLTQQVNDNLITELDKRIAIARAVAGANTAYADVLEKEERVKQAISDQEKDYIHLGSTIKDSLSQVFDALISGTLNFGDAAKSLGLAIGKRWIEGMLDSKLKDFDPAVKANFLDLGNFGSSVFGSIFQTAGNIVGLFTGQGGGTGLIGTLGSLVGLGQDASNFVGPLLADGSQGTTGGSLLSLLTGGNGSGSLGLTGGKGLLSYLGGIDPGLVIGGIGGGLGAFGGSYLAHNAFGIGSNTDVGRGIDIGGSALGGIGGAFAGAAAGGAVAAGLASSGLSIAMTGIIAGLAATGVGAIVAAVVAVLAALLGSAFNHKPTQGTLDRQAGEGVLDKIPTFADLQKNGLGDITRSDWRPDNPNVLAGQDKFGPGGVADIAGFSTIFAEQVFGKSAQDRVITNADQFTNILTAWFGRMQAEGEQASTQMKQTLLKAFQDMGVDAPKAFGLVNSAADHFFANFKPDRFFPEGAAADIGRAVRGVADIFQQQVPQGVNVAAIALQNLKQDGVGAFGELTNGAKDMLLALAKSPEAFDKTVGQLEEKGFRIDTEGFKNDLADISASADFVGKNIGDLFTSDNVNAGIDAMTAKLRESIASAVQTQGISQLFDTTRIGEAFQPVFAVLRQLQAGAFNLTTSQGSSDFSTQIATAIAQGKANLAEYIPQIKAIAAAFKDVQKAVDDALKPDPIANFYNQLADMQKAATANIRQGLASAIQAGLAEKDPTKALSTIGDSLKANLKQSIQQALIESFVQNAVIDGALAPMIAQIQTAIAAAMQDGVLDANESSSIGALIDHAGQAVDSLVNGLSPSLANLLGLAKGTNEQAGQARDQLKIVNGDLVRVHDQAAETSRQSIRAAQDSSDAAKEATRQSITDSKGAGDAVRSTTQSAANGLAQAISQAAGSTSRAVIGLGNTISDASSALAAFVSQLTGQAISSGGSRVSLGGSSGSGAAVRGFATGGTILPGGIGMVGEDGPELIHVGEGGKVVITPLGHLQGYRSGLGGSGGIGPITRGVTGDPSRGGSPADPSPGYTPPGLGGGDNPLGPGSGSHPRVPHDRGPASLGPDDQLPGFSSAITSAIQAGLEGSKGFMDDFADSLQKSVEDKLTEAVEKGFNRQGVVAKAAGDIDQLITKAENLEAQGKLDESTAKDIASQIAAKTAIITERARALEPILGQIRQTKAIADAVGNLGLDSILKNFAADPTNFESMHDALEQSINDATLQGVVQGLLASGPLHDAIVSATDDLNAEIKHALDTGDYSGLEGAADRAGSAIRTQMDLLGPVFEHLGLRIGDGAKRSTELVKNALSSAAEAGFKAGGKGYEDFAQGVRNSVYTQIKQGLIDAFIQSAVVQGALGPVLTQIQSIFTQIGQHQISIAQANVQLAQQAAAISGILADPAFRSAFQSTLATIGQIGTSLGQTVDVAQTAADTTSAAANVAQDAATAAKADCSGQCALEKKTYDLGFTAVNNFGRQGQVEIERYVPSFDVGGISRGPASGYYARLHGEEMVLASLRSLTVSAPADTGPDVSDALVRLADALENQPQHTDISIDGEVLVRAMQKAKKLARKAGQEL